MMEERQASMMHDLRKKIDELMRNNGPSERAALL